ncbi:MAG: hypothetical protein N2167_08630 [Flavobacteriales bacterium]|nr:hypothetical protein [Flavobacteriales bacterium]
MNNFSEISELLKNAPEASTLNLVASSKFKNIYVSTSDKLLIQVWNSETNLMTHEEFEEEANLLLNQVIIHKPAYVISDQRLYQHHISDKQHNWYVSEFVPKLVSSGIKKFAMIINEDLIQQVKLEEIVEDVERYQKNYYVPTRFFSTIADALQWK